MAVRIIVTDMFITKTRACNIQIFLKVENLITFSKEILIIFNFLLKIYCGYTFELPRQKLSIFKFYNLRKSCILHGLYITWACFRNMLYCHLVTIIEPKAKVFVTISVLK